MTVRHIELVRHSSALGQWESLVRYIELPEAEIDNNAAERSMRRVVLGRNYAERAVMWTCRKSCRARPYAEG